ncbi:MAG: flavodoxin family protein [Negativicutes bacterium]|nr:flavodoxin family protein [Negativicutes bacterium]
MKVLGINGSPRKNWNTATLLKTALDGASSQGAETEMIHLYDLNFKGCISCFACKRKGGESYGNCAYRDDLTPILDQIKGEADALLLGSPIYLHTATGEMRSFLERLLFPNLVYDGKHSSLFGKKIPTGFIYTMNVTETRLKERNYEEQLGLTQMMLAKILGSAEMLLVTDTYQFDDYSQYVSSGFDPDLKAKRRAEVFPADCQKAFDLGVKLVTDKIQ